MLKALYDYAIRENLILPPGYSKKDIHAYVSLSKDGQFLGIVPCTSGKVICPDIGSKANSTSKCNVIAEKRSILFPSDVAGSDGKSEQEKNAAKITYFRNTLADAATQESRLLFCLNAMEDPDTAAAILTQLNQAKISSSHVISFMVDGTSILEMPAVQYWWNKFRQQFRSQGNLVPCLITGQLTIPLATVPTVNGLSDVGGRSKIPLICFDKDAFCSYGLKKAANAPVSEEAFAGVNAALNHLLENAPAMAGIKFVHWYDKPLKKEEDFLTLLFADIQSDEENEADFAPSVNQQLARQQANALIDSVKTGAPVHELPHCYYILLLSGVNGRVMVRSYQRGNYRELTENLQQWENDLALVNGNGTGQLKPVKFTARLIRLIARQDSDKKIFDRLAKELAGLTPAILGAILNNSCFPDPVISRALAYIRSQMFSTPKEDTPIRKIPDPLACQWLKACLCQKERMIYNKEEISVEYNENHPEPAYHCGALLAVYGAIQQCAMPNVNATLIDRYYASASQTPALVLGQLARLSNYHLDKLEKLRGYFSNLRNQVSCSIGSEIPTVLRPEQQAYFALGYYQMCTQMEKNRVSRKPAITQPQDSKENEQVNE